MLHKEKEVMRVRGKIFIRAAQTSTPAAYSEMQVTARTTR